MTSKVRVFPRRVSCNPGYCFCNNFWVALIMLSVSHPDLDIRISLYLGNICMCMQTLLMLYPILP